MAEPKEDSPLLEAVRSGDIEEVQKILAAGAGDINLAGKDDDFPLLVAARKGNIELVNLLLQNGADLYQEGTYGQTPLHAAARAGKADVVQALLAAASKLEEETKPEVPLINRQNNKDRGVTALHLAVENYRPEVVTVLLQNGANPNIAMGVGDSPLYLKNTPLHLGVLAISIAGVIGRNADVLHQTINALVTYKPQKDQEGLDINRPNADGNTALHLAAEQKSSTLNSEIVGALMQNGAKSDVKNRQNKSPLELAKENRNGEIQGLIQGKKAGIGLGFGMFGKKTIVPASVPKITPPKKPGEPHSM